MRRARLADETAVGHHLPELLQQVRTNQDRILSHRNTQSVGVAITARTQGSACATVRLIGSSRMAGCRSPRPDARME
jgi:hypothetical protein